MEVVGDGSTSVWLLTDKSVLTFRRAELPVSSGRAAGFAALVVVHHSQPQRAGSTALGALDSLWLGAGQSVVASRALAL